MFRSGVFDYTRDDYSYSRAMNAREKQQQEAKQQNRTIRNTLDQRAALTGVSWNQASAAYKKNFGYDADLMNNSTLQWMYDYMGSSSARAPSGGGGSSRSSSQLSTIQKRYDQQLADLTARIKTIQNNPPESNIEKPKPPTTPYTVNATPISLSNPYKTKTMGGIGQFSSRQTNRSGLATIKSGLINI